MGSPFPGMDPYIASDVWEDFHQGFVAELAAALVPQVRPHYIVRKERRIYVDHPLTDDQRSFRSDLAVLSRDNGVPVSERTSAASATLAPTVVRLPAPVERREAFLTVLERSSMKVVAVIELLSPANKRRGTDGWREYLRVQTLFLRFCWHDAIERLMKQESRRRAASSSDAGCMEVPS